ncbi:hypothetical protein [Hyphococcus sp.]|uniref:hypothetical protein n=1 Tax=Hyphococcus sp. TaxID=2038636 RepID=UPI003D0DF075
MGWLEFIASIVNSLAWPGALVIVFLLLKDHIHKLPDYIKSFRYKDLVEITFQDKVQALKHEAESAGVELPVPLPSGLAGLLDIDGHKYNSVYLLAWKEIEARLDSLAEKHSLTGPMPTSRIIYKLSETGVISDADARALNEFREIRDMVVHSPLYRMDAEQARTVLKIAAGLISKLDEKL